MSDRRAGNKRYEDDTAAGTHTSLFRVTDSLCIDAATRTASVRKLRPGYKRLMGKLTGGTDSVILVSEDRGGR